LIVFTEGKPNGYSIFLFGDLKNKLTEAQRIKALETGQELS
jgi:hypothetical protein